MSIFFRTFIVSFIYGVLSNTLIADDIYLKSGTVLKNVKFIRNILSSNGDVSIEFLYDNKRVRLMSDAVSYIDSTNAYNSDASSYRMMVNIDSTAKHIPQTDIVLSPSDSLRQLEQRIRYLETQQKFNKKYEYPNKYFMAVAALGLVIGWDGFASAGEIQDAIDATNKFNNNTLTGSSNIKIDNSSYESQKTRKTIMGIVGIGVAIVATVYSLEKVEIKSDGKSLSLAYHF